MAARACALLTAGGEDATGFVVRHGGTAYAYLNRCAHVPIELDWNEGEFFESSKLYLMCSTHGAIYIPENGQCAGGPAVAAGCGRSPWSSATSRFTGNRTTTCAPRAPD
jgi:nitrite reductase/ring-hydroxylating ferredoxin subunit